MTTACTVHCGDMWGQCTVGKWWDNQSQAAAVSPPWGSMMTTALWGYVGTVHSGQMVGQLEPGSRCVATVGEHDDHCLHSALWGYVGTTAYFTIVQWARRHLVKLTSA